MNASSTTNSAKSEPTAGAAQGLIIAGIGVSAGIAIGTALLLGQRNPEVVERELRPDQVDAEVARFREALALSERQIGELRARVAEGLGERDAGIFDAHLMLLGDRSVNDEVEQTVRGQRRNADFVYQQVISRYSKALQLVEDPYIRERLADVRDVAARVIRNVQGEATVELAHLTEPRIVVAHDVSPSESASMHRGMVLGFATCLGSRTSHTAIMARSFGIPAAVGLCDAVERVQSGDRVILDGSRGLLILHPTPAQLEEYQERIRAQEEWFRKIVSEAKLPAETVDGFRVQLAANIELPDEVVEIKRSQHGVGIGLYRTEYLFLSSPTLPDEDSQCESYRRVVEEIYPQSVIIRTLDIGGDKFLSHLKLPQELNPFLGMRAIRFCLSQPDIFLCQLRAILRASAHGKVRILFPMIATVEELDQALACLQQARQQLDARGVHYNRHLDVGIMIEVPAAAIIADRLAPKVDFFSIGTNDLVQYSLAADRSNPAIAHLSQPCHPAIIRLLRSVMGVTCRNGIWASVCGEMASEPLMAPLLLGLGVQELSMSYSSIGPIKRLIRNMRMYEAEELVRQAAGRSTAQEVRQMCEQFVRRVAPDVLAEA